MHATQSTQEKLIIHYNKPKKNIYTSHEEAINSVAPLNNASDEETINSVASLNNEVILMNPHYFKESASWRHMDRLVSQIQGKLESLATMPTQEAPVDHAHHV